MYFLLGLGLIIQPTTKIMNITVTSLLGIRNIGVKYYDYYNRVSATTYTKISDYF